MICPFETAFNSKLTSCYRYTDRPRMFRSNYRSRATCNASPSFFADTVGQISIYFSFSKSAGQKTILSSIHGITEAF